MSSDVSDDDDDDGAGGGADEDDAETPLLTHRFRNYDADCDEDVDSVNRLTTCARTCRRIRRRKRPAASLLRLDLTMCLHDTKETRPAQYC